MLSNCNSSAVHSAPLSPSKNFHIPITLSKRFKEFRLSFFSLPRSYTRPFSHPPLSFASIPSPGPSNTHAHAPFAIPDLVLTHNLYLPRCTAPYLASIIRSNTSCPLIIFWSEITAFLFFLHLSFSFFIFPFLSPSFLFFLHLSFSFFIIPFLSPSFYFLLHHSLFFHITSIHFLTWCIQLEQLIRFIQHHNFNFA